jgi:biliverdin reductase
MVLRVGLVGTGYAAKVRAEAFGADARSQLVAIAGRTPFRTTEFSQPYGAEPMESWTDLVQRPDLDLIVISTINSEHGAIARCALEAGKHVVVEYPLALHLAEAEALATLAAAQRKLLHVEHIELLSGIHLALRATLPQIGVPFYVRYSNLNPQHPAPTKWTYQPESFGFPLVGAVSRIHRLTNLFGEVKTVSCRSRYWGREGLPSPYMACLCTAQLHFASGLIAEVIYGKGEAFWQAERHLTIHGERGAIAIDGEEGRLIQGEISHPLEIGSRRGLFARDTAMVLDHLSLNTPLYVSVLESLYALKVADAAQRSAETGQTVVV